ncbi:hypothetical protein FJY93_04085 [Candidatus Kaiserbacteria bacterium]|nr:hypothetical protein [Candidatus Kaiserbacteria bacterium]
MTFADKKAAETIVRNLYNSSKQISYIEHGYDNLVVLVDERYALRFPRNLNAYRRSQYEKQVLLKLSSLQGVDIPKVMGEELDPPFLITKFIRGQHLSKSQVNSFPIESQKKIGQKIATFAHTLHSLLSVQTVNELRKKYELDDLEEEPWDKHMYKMLIQTTFPTPTQDAFAKKYFDLWQSKANKPPTVSVHDDLHTDNMLFEGEELVGVLDFADTNIGTPEQEFRQLYRINETVLSSALGTYEKLSGQSLDIEVSKIWSIAQELATYAERLNDKAHPSFIRTVGNLQIWLPEGGWSEMLQ